MKEKSFRFRESFGKAIKAMNDKQAGKLLKGLCDYVFEGKSFDNGDITLKSSFALIKMTIDEERRDRENGSRGGKISAEMRKRSAQGILVVSSGSSSGNKTDEIINLVVSRTETKEKTSTDTKGEVSQK